MASDEFNEDVPGTVDDKMSESKATQVPDGPAGFADRVGGGSDDTLHSADEFGSTYSGQPSVAEKNAEELGERWGKGPDDSAERSEEFGATYAGDTQGTDA